ncbi:HU family DNA-binding protein [Anthocerotibacter panamensis]|uniref:HU family DNA-binding protein n=1 Tax=Anthocerotibacter panamensis TaxID=2857077 RepID=UPI001C403B24|nr:HU family DNA-binding protein [Anthocerotibacter panamensis]
MDCINRQELARLMAQRVDGLSQRLATVALQTALECISETLVRGGVVRLSEFGTFSLRKRPGRRILHPRTREPLEVAECLVPMFAPATTLRTRVGGQS